VDKLVDYFISKMRSTPVEDVEELLELLEKALKMFHNNHYVVTLLRVTLNTAYLKLAGRMGLEPHKVPAELHLKRKEFLDEIHKVIEIVEPGLSRRRGDFWLILTIISFRDTNPFLSAIRHFPV
jgi:intein/homing endonuclease